SSSASAGGRARRAPPGASSRGRRSCRRETWARGPVRPARGGRWRRRRSAGGRRGPTPPSARSAWGASATPRAGAPRGGRRGGGGSGSPASPGASLTPAQRVRVGLARTRIALGRGDPPGAFAELAAIEEAALGGERRRAWLALRARASLRAGQYAEAAAHAQA